jgi:predicted TIM-barrel fold metal-dependent hydrolase
VGIASYNPHEIGESTHRAEIGIKQHGFKGVYVHPGSFGVSVIDRRMYPLYANALGWKVPVILDIRPFNGETHLTWPAKVEQIAADLPELKFVVCQSHWPIDEVLRLVDALPNLNFCFDSESLVDRSVRMLVDATAGATRCLWGSNGESWKTALAQVARYRLENATRFLHENAVDLFRLDHLRKRKAKAFSESEEPLTRIVAE